MVAVRGLCVTTASTDRTGTRPPQRQHTQFPPPVPGLFQSGQLPSRCANTRMNRFARSPSMTR